MHQHIIQLTVLALSLGSVSMARADSVGFDRPQMESTFDSASREFDVPVQVLKAIAFVESRWFQGSSHEHAEGSDANSHQRAHGVMGLRDDAWFGRSLIEAANLIGKTPKALKDDPVLNIRGAAAYLKKLSDSERTFLNWSWGSEADRLLSWAGVIRRYSGIPSDPDAALYVSDIYSVLTTGHDKNGIFIARAGGIFPQEVLETRPETEPATATEYPGADWDPSGNFTANGTTPTHVVIHTTEGSFAGAVSWHKNPDAGVSSHFIIRARDGYTKQLVKTTDRAWHARCWNKVAVGIEHEAWSDNPDSFTDTLYQSSSRLVKFLSGKHDIPVHPRRVIGHGFKSSVYFPGSSLEPCNDHTDPGMFWDWESYFALLGLSPMPNPAPPSEPAL